MSFLNVSSPPSTLSASAPFRRLNRIRSIGSVFSSRSTSPRPLSIIAESVSFADSYHSPVSSPTRPSASPISPPETPTIEIRRPSNPIDPFFPQTTSVHINDFNRSELFPTLISSVGGQRPTPSSAPSSSTSHNNYLLSASSGTFVSTTNSTSSGQSIRSTLTPSRPSSPSSSSTSKDTPSVDTMRKGFGRQKQTHPFSYSSPARISISPPTPSSSPARSATVDSTHFKKRTSILASNLKRSCSTPLTKPSTRQRQRRRDPVVPSEYISFLDLSLPDPVPSSSAGSSSTSSSCYSDSSDRDDEHDRWISSSSSCSQDEGLLSTPPESACSVVIDGHDDLARRRGSESDALDDATFFSVEVEKMLRRHEEVRASWAWSRSLSLNVGVISTATSEEQEEQEEMPKTAPTEVTTTATTTTVSPVGLRTSPPPRPPRRAPPPPISVSPASRPPSPFFCLPISSDSPSPTTVTAPTTARTTTPNSPQSAISNFSTSSRASRALAMALAEEEDVEKSVRGSVYEPVEPVDDEDDADMLEGVEIRLAPRSSDSVRRAEEPRQESGVPILTSSIDFMFDSRSSPEDVREETEEGSDSEQFFTSTSDLGSDVEDGMEDERIAYVPLISSIVVPSSLSIGPR